MTPMNHDDRGGVALHRSFQITAEVAHQVAAFACTELLIVEHGHGGVDHDKP